MQSEQENHSGEPDPQRRVRFLSAPSSYPEPVSGVEVIETHFAWVFLTDHHAWKMKKPIKAQVIDYRRLEDREYFCRQELRLNRRLADWVYLDVVPLTEGADGEPAIDGDGRVVDWLVKMRRLAAGKMLDRIIARGELSSGQLERTASHLADFYRNIAPESLGADDYLARLDAQIQRHERQLREVDAGVSAAPWQDVLDAQREYVRSHPDQLGVRATGGCIVEAHGDLRPEHIYLGRRIAIIDCLEFSRDLRVQDSAEEIAFLALEIERAADRSPAEELLARYACFTGDEIPRSVTAFYLSRRAVVRAILSAWHLADPAFDRDYYIAQTLSYLGLGREFIAEAMAAETV